MAPVQDRVRNQEMSRVETKASNTITLRGSAQIVTEYFGKRLRPLVVTNTVLFARCRLCDQQVHSLLGFRRV